MWTLKKLLAIVSFILLICNIGYSQESCYDFVSYEADYVDNNIDKSSRKNAVGVLFKYKSTSDKKIKIVSTLLKTDTGQTIREKRENDEYLKPFGRLNVMIMISDLNKDVIAKTTFTCKFASKSITSNNQKKSTTNNWSRTNDKPKGNVWIWGGLAALFLGFVFWIGGLLDKQSIFITKIKDRKNKNISKISKNKSIQKNLIQEVWDGNETLSKTFWVYCILIGVVVSLISGVLMGLASNIFFIIPLIYFVWSSIGLWNSSTKYQNSKLKLQQSYGWAIASKVYVVLNLFTVFGQSILLFAN